MNKVSTLFQYEFLSTRHTGAGRYPVRESWIPACTGMTTENRARDQY